MRAFCIALIAVATLILSPARAQDSAAPFDGDLLRLAEILGSLHYLRGICGSNEGQKWRNQMQLLVDAETPGGDRRTRMIASFNRGYRGFPPLSRGRLENLARPDCALRELAAASARPNPKKAGCKSGKRRINLS